MLRKLQYLFIFFCCSLGYGQTCPSLTNPIDGATNVSVNTSISWNSVVGVPGYLISIGTTPGGTDIINSQSIGSATSFTPALGLPENTQVYVTITLFFINQPNIVCGSETFTTENVVTPPPCTTLNSPADGSTNINGATNLSWGYSSTATGYRLTLGTTPGGGEILNNVDLNNTLFYNPPLDFPPDTQIYILITPYNENGSIPGCNEESFTTGPVAVLPGCATMTSPLNGAINVPLTPLLEWTDVPGAAGYRVSLGSSPFVNDVLDNVAFGTNSTFVLDFEPNSTFFISITPFNAAGEAISCGQESFSTILGCGPYFDAVTGELVTLNPEINFPDTISFCQNEVPFLAHTTDVADGYRWYKIDTLGNETLISESDEVALTEIGQYRYEAYNFISQFVNTIECPSSKEFSVVSSELATITNVEISGPIGNTAISIQITGIGDYEYALNNSNGPFQDSNTFTSLPEVNSYTVYVRDKNGCGTVEQKIEQDITVEGFPKFFTPNGDGINDFWQFIPPPLTNESNLIYIQIFDRYGNFLAQIDPESQGWDGRYRGKSLPSSSYWFRAVSVDGEPVQGAIALKR
ncbi:MAG: hypothetical protein COA50_02405 [Flavobacteriaceae bacterium]|nr:MAG: hypothetical protein COA50_02405 [Flavobacteriaceae bacterium]